MYTGNRDFEIGGNLPKVVQLMGRRACTTQRSWGHSEPQAKHVGPAVPEHPALQKNHLSLPARSRLTAVSMVGGEHGCLL